MATWCVDNTELHGGEYTAVWQATHAYSLGARCVCKSDDWPTVKLARVYECTRAGTSGASQPGWNTTPDTGIVDDPDAGGAEWTCRMPDDWDNASCFLSYVTGTSSIANGDVVLVHKEHSESFTSGVYFGGADIDDYPILIYCVDKDDGNALSTGAVFSSTAEINFREHAYCYGISFISSLSTWNFLAGISFGYYAACWIFENCLLKLSGENGNLYFGADYQGYYVLLDTDIEFSSALGRITTRSGTTVVEWRGGKLIAPSGMNFVFRHTFNDLIAHIYDVDLSDIGEGGLINSSALANLDLLLVRCKLPSEKAFGCIWDRYDYKGKGPGIRMFHCSAGNNTYEFEQKQLPDGSTFSDITVAKTGGAAHDATLLSYRMVAEFEVKELVQPLWSPHIEQWVESTDEKVFFIEGIIDADSMIQDDEIWMELEYPANDTDGLGDIISDRCIPLDAPADQEESLAVWNSTGAIATALETYGKTSRAMAGGSYSKLNIRNRLPNGTFANSGTRFRIRIGAADVGVGCSQNLHITGASIGVQDTTYNYKDDPAPVRITFNGGDNGATVLCGRTLWSDWVDFAFDKDVTHLVHVALLVDSTNWIQYSSYSASNLSYKESSATNDDTMVLEPAGTYTGDLYHFAAITFQIASEKTIQAFRLSVTATPGKAGPITARVALAKPSATIYIDPTIQEEAPPAP